MSLTHETFILQVMTAHDHSPILSFTYTIYVWVLAVACKFPWKSIRHFKRHRAFQLTHLCAFSWSTSSGQRYWLNHILDSVRCGSNFCSTQLTYHLFSAVISVLRHTSRARYIFPYHSLDQGILQPLPNPTCTI
jgi:hypothetical protein